MGASNSGGRHRGGGPLADTQAALDAAFDAALDSTQALAVGAAGTSVIDLESPTLGLEPQAGGRGRFSVPVGDMVLRMSVAAERDLPPPAIGATYWQGAAR